jgi:hypothetical protein
VAKIQPAVVEDCLPLEGQHRVVNEDAAIDFERARSSVLTDGFPQRMAKIHVDQ